MAVNESFRYAYKIMSFWYIYLFSLFPGENKIPCTLVDKSIFIEFDPIDRHQINRPFANKLSFHFDLSKTNLRDFSLKAHTKWEWKTNECVLAQTDMLTNRITIKVYLSPCKLPRGKCLYSNFILNLFHFFFVSKKNISELSENIHLWAPIPMSPSSQRMKRWNIRRKSNIYNETDFGTEPVKKQ